MSRRVWTSMLLAVTVIGSSLVVVKAKHDNRRLTNQLSELRAERARLDNEWVQLQLEEATLSHHGRIEQVAREKLGMTDPEDHAVVEADRR